MIFISGQISGAYRAQNIFKALADNNKKIVYLPWMIFGVSTKSKYITLFVKLLLVILMLPIRILLIMLSSQIVVLPMNTNKLSLLDVIIGRAVRKKVIYEYYISRYDSNVNDRGIYKEGTWRAKVELFYDKAFTYFSTHIVCLNEAEVEFYKPYMCRDVEDKIRIIPLVIDPVINVRRVNKETNVINYCWWGTYIPLHGLDNLINGFNLSCNLNAKLWIFGDSEEKSKPYQELVNELGLSNRVAFNHEYTFKNGKLPSFLTSNRVVSIGIFGDSDKAKNVLVNKIIDSCALSLPVLTAETNGSKLFFEDNLNIMYTGRDVLSISEKMNAINNGDMDIGSIGVLANEVYVQNFSPDVFREKFMSVIDE